MGAPVGNQYAKGNPGGGRPSLYKRAFCKLAKHMCALGATDLEVADALGVSVSTLNKWKALRKEFNNALKRGKEQADERVEQSLYARATGYSHDAVKIMQSDGVPITVPYIEHVAPDTTACIFWLKNRRPGEWRDVNRTELVGKDGGPIHQNIFVGKEPLMKEGELEGLVGALERAPGLENKLNGNGVTNGNGTHNGNGQH